MLSAEELSKLDHTPIGFGKYRNSTPDEIAEADPKYLVWAFENVTNRPVFMSELLYKECLAAPDTRRTYGQNTSRPVPRAAAQPGSLQESRSHFDDPDDTPF